MLIPELAVNPLATSIIDAFLLTEGYVSQCLHSLLSLTHILFSPCLKTVLTAFKQLPHLSRAISNSLCAL